MSSFGPPYHKIDTAFKRDERGVIVPDELSRPEFEYLLCTPWRWTEKVDGTNIRLHWADGAVTMGGRTDRASLPAKLVSAVEGAGLLDPALWSSVFPPDGHDSGVTVYGEGYGPGIQKGGSYRDDQALVVFDVRVGGWWLRPEDVADVASRLGLEVAPLVLETTLKDMIERVARFAEAGMYSAVAADHGKTFDDAEGVVGTPTVGLLDRAGRRIVTKLKLKDFRDLARRGS